MMDDFWQIREASIRFLVHAKLDFWPSLFEEFSGAVVETLARADKSEGQLYRALRFVTVFFTSDVREC
jgi:hypothetical protein